MIQKNIHWYPGHMKKAWHQVQERLAQVDVVIEVVDARAIPTSRYQALEISSKQFRILLIVKEDLADPHVTAQWVTKLKEVGLPLLHGNLHHRRIGKVVLDKIKEVAKPLHLKQISKGMKPQPIKVMIVGVPNVGKSTLINNLANKQKVNTENRPGSTRGQQWIALDKDVLLLDTPGVLPPVYTTDVQGMHLALIHAIRLDILPLDDLGSYLFTMMHRDYPQLLAQYVKQSVETKEELLRSLAKLRGMKQLHDTDDLERAQLAFIQDWQRGKIGAMSLETPYALNT